MWAGVIAWWHAFAGKKQVTWQPTIRLAEPSCGPSAAQSLQPSIAEFCVDQEFEAESICDGCASESTRVLAVIGEKSC
jgi:hypothetical protein